MTYIDGISWEVWIFTEFVILETTTNVLYELLLDSVTQNNRFHEMILMNVGLFSHRTSVARPDWIPRTT